MSNDTHRRYWTPPWETRQATDRTIPSPEVRPWSFRASNGKIVDLQVSYQQVPNLMDHQRPIKWQRVPGAEPRNPHKNILLSWDQAQKVASLSRERDWPLNKCVAAVIDTDEIAKSQLAALAKAPSIWAVTRATAVGAKVEAKYDDSVKAFLAEAKAGVTPAAPAKKAAEAPAPAPVKATA